LLWLSDFHNLHFLYRSRLRSHNGLGLVEAGIPFFTAICADCDPLRCLISVISEEPQCITTTVAAAIAARTRILSTTHVLHEDLLHSNLRA